ncbi:MAG TPA: SDR family oxidoreductase [Bacteroidales bacterium]|nr:SDR family oxidoreductase [Bacteroidales bacterium]HRW97399.1 SDR family oxidoreductase [Bacteroidales bacterium]
MNIIVTGASQGLGYALVRKLAQSGNHRIIALSRNSRKLKEMQKTCAAAYEQSKVFPLPFDLAAADYQPALQSILQCIDKVDILVNNAGLLVRKPFELMTDEDFDTIFNINVKSVFRLSQLLLPYFSTPAHIVNISSMGGFQGSAKFPGLSLYSAAKGAVVVLTETMAEELKDTGIKVNCLAFGAVQTEMLSSAFPGYKAPIKPDEMANFVADFALNGHRYFNGKTLPVSSSTP